MKSGVCLGVLGLLVWGAMACDARETSESPGEPPGGSSSSSSPPVEKPAPPPSRPDPNRLEAVLDVAGGDRVEVMQVVEQARTLALRLEPDVELMGIGASRLREGMIDLREAASTLASVTFHFRRQDPRQPPGRDVTEGEVQVGLIGNTLRARRDVRSATMYQVLGPATLPACPVRSAWAAVVRSGVPRDAIAGVSLWRTRKGGAAVWSFSVEGHGEHNRSVDPQTCAVQGPQGEPARAPAGQPAPKPAAKPAAKPAPKADCGCRAGDKLCQFMCR